MPGHGGAPAEQGDARRAAGGASWRRRICGHSPCASPEALQDLGASLVNALEYWWGRGAEKVKLTASVGAALIGKGAVAKDIFAVADQALYRVKADGKGAVQLAPPPAATNAA